MTTIDDRMLTQLAADVCVGMLGLTLRGGARTVPFGATSLVATVELRGDCRSTVEIEATPALARTIATAMCRVAPAELTDDDVEDALGEIANMVGGNLKGLLCGRGQLGLPSVERRRPRRGGDGAVASEAILTCAGERLVVRALRGREASVLTCDK